MRVRGEDDLARLAASFNQMATSLQRQIRQLEDLSRVQRRFVSDVSHELRTPLTTVRMAADVLHEARDEFDPAVERSAEILQAQLDRFEALLADLLEISRYDAGAAVLEAEPTDLRVLARHVIEAMETLAERKGSDLRLVEPGVACVAEVDAGGSSGSCATWSSTRSSTARAGRSRSGSPPTSDAVAVAVRDHGVGLEPEAVGMVFNRFWRADPARARTTGGTGLGLSIALEDAHLHGGWLQAWGEPGDGCQFRLTVPRRLGAELERSPIPLEPMDSSRRRAAADRRPALPPDPHPGGGRCLSDRRLGVAAAAGAARGWRSRAARRSRRPARCAAGGDLGLQRADDGVARHRPGHRRQGADPENIVLGFLQSNADFVNDHEVAREYLTPRARQRWRPQAGTAVYDQVAAPLAVAAVRRRHRRRGRRRGGRAGSTRDGSFVRSADRTATVTRTFGLQRVDGEWRIAALDDGLLLSAGRGRGDLPAGVAVLPRRRPGTTLVPDPVLLPGAARPEHQAGGPAAARADRVAARRGRRPRSRRAPRWRSARCRCATGSRPCGWTSSALQADDDGPRADVGADRLDAQAAARGAARCASPPAARTCSTARRVRGADHDPWPTYDPDDLPASPSAYVVLRRPGRALPGRRRSSRCPVRGGTGPPTLRSPGGVAGRHPAGGGEHRRPHRVRRSAGPGRPARAPHQRHRPVASPSWDPRQEPVGRRPGDRAALVPRRRRRRAAGGDRAPRWAPSASRSPCPSRGTGPGSRWWSAPDGRPGCDWSPSAGRRPPTRA